MALRCNGIGCGEPWNCDECRQTGDCNRQVICDVCGAVLCEGDTFFDIDGEHQCEECLRQGYERTV